MPDKNWFITPEGDMVNLDHVARIAQGTNVGVDDMVVYLILGSQPYTATSGSNAVLSYTYASSAAAAVIVAKYKAMLIAMGRIVTVT